jgi:hypothetical protein
MSRRSRRKRGNDPRTPCSGDSECSWRLIQIDRGTLSRQKFPPVSHSTKSTKFRSA